MLLRIILLKAEGLFLSAIVQLDNKFTSFDYLNNVHKPGISRTLTSSSIYNLL